MHTTKLFLDYAASYLDAILTFSARTMVLSVHSKASYLMEPKEQSRAGGHFFMSNNSDNPKNNGEVLNITQIIKLVMLSAAEVEIGTLHLNSKQAIPTRTVAIKMRHPQPPTPIKTDNTTVLIFVLKNLQQRAIKSADMK